MKDAYSLENIERLHRAAVEEFKACPTWQPMLEASAQEIEALKLRAAAEALRRVGGGADD